MYARVTRVLEWILRIIQPGECGRYKDAALRKGEKIKKGKKEEQKLWIMGQVKEVLQKLKLVLGHLVCLRRSQSERVARAQRKKMSICINFLTSYFHGYDDF